MTKVQVFQDILKDLIQPEGSPVEEVLLYLVVLHPHSLVPYPDLPIEDAMPTPVMLAPLTVSHLAELVASLWNPQDEKGHSHFWRDSYSRLTPYQLFEELPEELLAKALAAKERI